MAKDVLETGKAVLAPVYVSVAWILMISYQLFTQTAVVTVVTSLSELWPSTLTVWLASRVETIVFITAFAWIFLLSSVIPSAILGKERSVLIQFVFCLALTLTSIWVKDTLPLIVESQAVDKILSLAGFFDNPLFAAPFLAAPYLLMLLRDVLSNRKKNETRRVAESAPPKGAATPEKPVNRPPETS